MYPNRQVGDFTHKRNQVRLYDMIMTCSGTNQKIIFLHGWGGGSILWEPLWKFFGEYQCIGVDLPGHGDSENPPPNASFKEIAEIIQIKLIDPSPCHLAGWSLGGMIALEMVRQNPERYKSLVLIGSTARFTATSDYKGGQSMNNLESLRKSWEKNPLKTLEWFRSQLPAPSERKMLTRKDFLELFGRLQTPEKSVGALYLDYLAEVDLRDSLKTIKIPTLIIHGEKDGIIPFPAAEYLAKNIIYAKLQLIPESGHIPHLTKVEHVAELLKSFWSNL